MITASACTPSLTRSTPPSAHFSWTNAAEFRRFCAAAGIRCDDVAPERYFNPGLCDGAFLTTEYTYDAQILKRRFLEQLAALPNVEVLYSHKPTAIEKVGSAWRVQAGDITAEAPYLLNATYAGVNDVHAMLGLPPFGIKYEKCEIILCTVDKSLKNTGITVMDGRFQPDALWPDRPAQPDERDLHPA